VWVIDDVQVTLGPAASVTGNPVIGQPVTVYVQTLEPNHTPEPSHAPKIHTPEPTHGPEVHTPEPQHTPEATSSHSDDGKTDNGGDHGGSSGNRGEKDSGGSSGDHGGND
jgi:hypothetical protein